MHDDARCAMHAALCAIGVFTVDAGSKALAAEVPAPIATVLGAESHVALGPSEEHLPMKATAVERPARGTVLYLVPKHVSGGSAHACRVSRVCWSLTFSGLLLGRVTYALFFVHRCAPL